MKLKPTQICLVIITVIFVIATLQLNKVKTNNVTLHTRMYIQNSIIKQLNIDREQSKDIVDYIMVNSIDMNYAEVKEDINSKNNVVIIHAKNFVDYILFVDDDYNILEV